MNPSMLLDLLCIALHIVLHLESLSNYQELNPIEKKKKNDYTSIMRKKCKL